MNINNMILIVFFNTASIIFAQIDSSTLQYYQPISSNQTNLNSAVDSSKLSIHELVQDSLSETPTVKEINKLFHLSLNGKRDLSLVASRIARQKEKSIPALEELLYESPIANTKNANEVKLKREFAINTLSQIYMPSAIDLLINVAESHSDLEVRSRILKFLVRDYFERVCGDSIIPNKQLLHVLLKYAQDTNSVKNGNLKIREISQKGIKKWASADYNTLLNISIKTLPDIDEWWQKNNEKILWDSENKQFFLSN